MVLEIIISIVLIVAVAVLAFVNQPSFGRTPQGKRRARMIDSPFYRNGKIVNETPTVLMTGSDGFLAVCWKFITGAGKCDRLVPKAGEVPVVKTDLNALRQEGDLYVWFGHSSFMLRLSGKVILVDPVLVKASPVAWACRPFPGTDVYKPEDMPARIDYLVISHDHWDHLDCSTVKALRHRVDKVVCPLGVGEHLLYWGYTEGQIIELDANESDGWFHCLATRHFSGRGLGDRMVTQRAAWLIDSGERKVFYSGDGGYGPHFERHGKEYPGIDLAIMENGQYDARWCQVHTMPHELGKELTALAPRRFVTVHHSKFALGNHQWDEPRRNEQQAAEQSGIPLVKAAIGEVIEL